VRTRGDYRLEPSPHARYHHAAARNDVAAGGIDGDIPGSAPGAEVCTKVVEPRPCKHAVGLVFDVRLIAVRDLELDDRVPEILLRAGRRVERLDDHVPVLPRMCAHLVAVRDQPDALVQVVAAAGELLPREAGDAAGLVPRERPMAHAPLITEFQLEQPLPTLPVPNDWRPVEQQQVAPVVRRVGGRPDDQVAVPLLDDAIQ
jgi:hypothetical protein